MATPRDLTMRNRAQQMLVARSVRDDVRKLWPRLKWDDLDGSYESLAAPVGLVVRKHRQDSAALTGGYLRAHRLASGVRGDFRPVIAGPVDPERFATALRVTSVVAVKESAARGVAAELAMANALAETIGAMVELSLDAGRETLTATVAADPKAGGWQRVAGASACEMCFMLSDRGPVYSEGTVDFATHGNCMCSGSPIWGDQQVAVKEYTPSARPSTEASRARVREYMKANPHVN